MAILCIDTSTDHGTVAVARGDVLSASVCWHSAGRHGENLFGHIEAALYEAGLSREELSLIGVSVGPGKFTSLRVGLSTAKGLALGLALPIVGVTSLRVLARAIAAEPGTVRVPMMNAYRGDVFAAAYLIANDALVELAPPLFGTPERVCEQLQDAIGVRPVVVGGDGARTHASVIGASLGAGNEEAGMSDELSTSEAIVAEVQYIMHTVGPADLDTLEPLYLRPSDATLPKRPPSIESPS